MSLTSVELNYLIWRYLSESGHDLAAYAVEKHTRCLEYEHKNNKFLGAVAPGALASLVQKGILYSLAEDAAAGNTDRLSLAQALTAPALTLDAQPVPPVSPENSPAAPEPDARPHSTKTLARRAALSPAVTALWSPTGDAVVCGREDALAAIFEVASNVLDVAANSDNFAVVPVSPAAVLNHTATDGTISTVSWTATGIATAGVVGEVRAWWPDGRLRNIANSPTDPARAPSTLTALQWCPHKQLALTTDAHNTVSIWDGSSWTLLLEVRSDGAPDSSAAACWVGDLKFAVSTAKHTIKIYSLLRADGAAVVAGQLAGHAHVVLALVFSDISKLLASASDADYAIKVWNSLLPAEALELNVRADRVPYLHYHRAPVVGLFWLARAGDVEGNQLVLVLMDGAVNVWDAFLGDVLVLANVFHNPDNFQFDGDVDVVLRRSLVFGAAVSPDLTVLALGDDVGNVTVWDINPGHYAGTRDLLRCVGIYAVAVEHTVGENGETGICDLVWDPLGTQLCVCYKGSDSVVLATDV